MKVPISEMMVGDKLAFDLNGWFFTILSSILGMFEPSWRKMGNFGALYAKQIRNPNDPTDS